MNAIQDFLYILLNEQISLPAWEITALLAVLSIAMLLKASRTGILIGYMFTFHLVWVFLRIHFGASVMIPFWIFGGLLLLLGIASVIHER